MQKKKTVKRWSRTSPSSHPLPPKKHTHGKKEKVSRQVLGRFILKDPRKGWCGQRGREGAGVWAWSNSIKPKPKLKQKPGLHMIG
mmetsp:Transcript_8209/g.13314  ORF Transcript_8209/g.13314 Transcript_8209/m.13314 type:complete len:85 (+) Transcript_8209:523-777(+)